MQRNPVHVHKTTNFPNAMNTTDALIAILESSFDGIHITDGQANTIWISHSCQVISGLDEKGVVGKNMTELKEYGIISRFASLMALESRNTITIDQTFRTGKRTIITSTPVFDKQNEIIMVAISVRDISELYNLEEQLVQEQEQAQRYEGEIEVIRKRLMQTSDMVVVDAKMLNLLRMVGRAALLDTPVLLLGETGAGKEMAASYLHKKSPRRDGPFIKVSRGAVPEALTENELFGYERGAFTGTNREGKAGLFEIADKGTIFLDEVGELPASLQVRLLRVLQEQEIVRMGTGKPIKVDVRAVAATNRDVESMVKSGKLWEDLYYRLNVFPVHIPPLHERQDDIPKLAQNMPETLNRKYNQNKSLTQSAFISLLEHSWPGNVRELKNVMERSFIISDTDEIGSVHLTLQNARLCPDPGDSGEDFDLKVYPEKIEEEYIDKAYENKKNVRSAAQSLRMDPATYVRKRQKYNVKLR